jgi:dihydroflavonol-4-reductase
MKIDTSSPVMVTGSTGYIGGVLVKQLLEAGLTVHCPVRDPTNGSKLRHLKNLEGSERLKFYEADLLEKGSYTESAKNCAVVFHVASPFLFECTKGNEQEELIDPALRGTLNVLESVADPSLKSCVKRVVLTSSVNAIASDGKDCQDAFDKTGKVIDETAWNESASIRYQPYAYSKTLAEQAAWKFLEDNQNCAFDLAVCNPSFVLGPGLAVHESAESFLFLKRLGGGAYRSGIPRYYMAIVDVRDVARGHIAAGFLPQASGQRIILHGTNTTMMGASSILSEHYSPAFPLPTLVVPKWCLWCAAPLLGMTRNHVSRNMGTKFHFDNSRSLDVLELGAYTPLTQTLHEMFRQCVDHGYIKPTADGSGDEKQTPNNGAKKELVPNLHYVVSAVAIVYFLARTYLLE